MKQNGVQRRIEVDRAFVQEHLPWMLRLASRVLNDAHLAEDAVQEALFTAHAKGDGFQGQSDIRTWLYRVTVNAALALQRKKPSHECDIDDLQPMFDANACRIEEPWGQLRTIEEVLEQTELTAFVQHSVYTLPEDFRICLQLRDFEELSVKEVSEVLGISEENVKVRTHRARSALKRLLEPLLRGRPIQEITAGGVPEELKPSFARVAKGVMMTYVPMMITCQQFEEFIMEYLEDTLPKEKHRLFEFHIRTCRECREYLAAYQRSREITQGCIGTVATLDDVPKDLIAAVTKTLGQ